MRPAENCLIESRDVWKCVRKISNRCQQRSARPRQLDERIRDRISIPEVSGSPANIHTMRLLIAVTGASGSVYAQRLLDHLDPAQHDVHVIQSQYAPQVVATELPGGLRLREGVQSHSYRSMNLPFASGSNPPDAMVVIPCSMGTLGRIAHGVSSDSLLRCADVMLKERRQLILVPRETPLS